MTRSSFGEPEEGAVRHGDFAPMLTTLRQLTPDAEGHHPRKRREQHGRHNHLPAKRNELRAPLSHIHITASGRQ